jgi:23S rRNA pseudouridine2605 synthase
MAELRLQRFLAQAGVAARRKAELLITQGRVRVDGRVVVELGTKVDPERSRVSVDGAEVHAQELFYVLLNKPKGCITSVSDPQGRRTVMEYLPNLPVTVFPVGRLDYHSEGVLLMTNDGELAAALLAPDRHVEKTYHVKVRGTVSNADLARLRQGVRIGPRTVTRAAQVDRLKAESKHDWLVVTLTEGKARQIHRMMDAVGHTVLKLQRVAFAGISYHGLRVGDARELSQGELNGLYELAGLARNARVGAAGRWSARREDTDHRRRAGKRGLPEKTMQRAQRVQRPPKRAFKKPSERGAQPPFERPKRTTKRGGRGRPRSTPSDMLM